LKKAIKIIAVSLLLLFLLKGVIYRLVIKYNEIGTRQEVEIIDNNLIKLVDNSITKNDIDYKGIIKVSRTITNDALRFTFRKASSNPNELLHLKNANCLGYSHMFNSIVNHVIKKYKLQDKIKAKHKIGQLEFLGLDLHSIFKSPFFKDHDYNVIEDLNTGEIIVIDPSVSDFLGIHRVAEKN